MAIAYLFVTCADCGAEVDRLEYEPDTPAPAVQTVADALGLDLSDARKLVRSKNPGAELSSEEQTRALADRIVATDAELDRTPESYACPSGHEAGLAVSDTNPTPVVVTRLTKVAG